MIFEWLIDQTSNRQIIEWPQIWDGKLFKSSAESQLLGKISSYYIRLGRALYYITFYSTIISGIFIRIRKCLLIYRLISLKSMENKNLKVLVYTTNRNKRYVWLYRLLGLPYWFHIFGIDWIQLDMSEVLLHGSL